MQSRIIVHFYDVGKEVDSARGCRGRETLSMMTMITEYSTGPSTHLKVFYIYDVRCQFILLCMKEVSFRSRYLFNWGHTLARSNHMGSHLDGPNRIISSLCLLCHPAHVCRDVIGKVKHRYRMKFLLLFRVHSMTIIAKSEPAYDDAVLCHPYT
jgi:hypothetical protein